MVMPTYSFKCKTCSTIKEIQMSLSEYGKFVGDHCANVNCSGAVDKEDQQINFEGYINMAGASAMGVNQKMYSNKAGGPVGLSRGKPVGRVKV
jgi:hypothetical protein